jgi:geranylgeranyl diphosphate synthase type I
MVSQQIATGGKRIRARLALEACASFGVDSTAAIKWAAAMELLHNATLIHDDIQDGDTTRRGRPTVWATHGVAQAINAGDLMLMLPFLAVAEMDGPGKAELSALIAETATHIVRGQVEELGLKEAGRLDLESYVSACRGKTGALIALPVMGAALLGGRTHDEALALESISFSSAFSFRSKTM